MAYGFIGSEFAGGGGQPSVSSSSGQNFSFGQSQSTGTSGSTFGPVQTPETDLEMQIATLAEQLGQQVFQWAQGVFAQTSAITDQMVNSFLATSQTATQLAGAQLDHYLNTTLPEMNQLSQMAGQYNSTARQQLNMGAAEEAANQAGTASMQNTLANLRSFGVDPSSGMYGDILAAQNTGIGAAEAGAGEQAQINTANTGRQLLEQSIAAGQQLPGDVVNALNQAYQGVAGAENSVLSNANVGATLQNLAPNFFNVGSIIKPASQAGTSNSSQRSNSFQTSFGKQGSVSSGGGGGSKSNNNARAGQGNGTSVDTAGPYRYGPLNNPSMWMGTGNRGGGYANSGGGGSAGGGGGGRPGGGAQVQTIPNQEPFGPPNPFSQGGIMDPNSSENQTFFNPQSIAEQGGIGTDPWSSFSSGNLYNNPGVATGQNPATGPYGDFFQNPTADPGASGQGFTDQTQFGPSTSGFSAPPSPYDDFFSTGQGGGDQAPTSGDNPFAAGQDTSLFDQSGASLPDLSAPTSGTAPDTGGGGFGGGYTPPVQQTGSYGGGYGGGYAGGGGGYARGGVIRGVNAGGLGVVPSQASPSGGARTDDVHAKLNAGEFVIPKDVAAWKGHEFFQKLIDGSRKARLMGSAQGKPTSPPRGPVRFNMAGAQ